MVLARLPPCQNTVTRGPTGGEGDGGNERRKRVVGRGGALRALVALAEFGVLLKSPHLDFFFALDFICETNYYV